MFVKDVWFSQVSSLDYQVLNPYAISRLSHLWSSEVKVLNH